MKGQDSLLITRAGIADAPVLGAVHAAAWRSAYKGLATDAFLDAFTPDKRTAFFARTLPTTSNEHYLLSVRGETIGMLAIGEADASENGPSCGEVIALYLLAPHVGQGWGKNAMDFAVHRLRMLGYDKIVLTVLSENHRALRFYQRYGFVPDGEEEIFHMGKDLLERRYRLEDTSEGRV